MTPTTDPPNLDPVLLSDARIAAIPVVERGEDLVRVVAAGRLSVADAIPVPPAVGVAAPQARDHDLLRCEVARRLATAAATLPDHVRLHLVEGFRAPEMQAALYEAHRRHLHEKLAGI